MIVDDVNYIEETGSEFDPQGGGIKTGLSRKPDSLEDKLAIADIYARRVKKIMQNRELNVAEFAKTHGGWFKKDEAKFYPDGSYDTLSPTIVLQKFLDHDPEVVPDKAMYRKLEHCLGYKENQIFTHFNPDLKPNEWFIALGLKTEKGTPTSKYWKLPRVKNYRKVMYKKKKEAERLQKAELKRFEKEKKQQKEQQRKNWLENIKRKAGIHLDPKGA